jgi:predicted ATPase
VNEPKLTFHVISGGRIPAKGVMQAFLVEDGWDDWFKYSTMYYLWVFDTNGVKHDIGSIKIGQFDMPSDQRRAGIPASFHDLDARFFSLGQGSDYYENVMSLGNSLSENVLNSLRDIVIDQDDLERIFSEEVARISLLRSVSRSSIKGQFFRIVSGKASLTKYAFQYLLESSRRAAGIALSFSVIPEANPPTNIHVLIGRNGVGKTFLLNNMVKALMNSGADQEAGSFSFDEVEGDESGFSRVVSVSFSAFDNFELLDEQRDKSLEPQYTYIGLRRTNNRGGEKGTPKSHDMLCSEFGRTIRSCISLGRIERLNSAISSLETDPLFAEISPSSLFEENDAESLQTEAIALFKKLSSGHGIVLLILCRLVETVEEKTLVLLDEPEAHLHPPLLSAFVRALSDLLTHRNGVGVIATHSPVIAQEVPKSCLWKIRRQGYQAVAERPDIETFGENVGILTREIFGLEVTRSGFHKLIENSIASGETFEEVVHKFGGQLGAEARAILRALINERDFQG